MKIFITGATGFIGRALISQLNDGHHQLTALVRDTVRASQVLPATVELIDSLDNFLGQLPHSDAVINLAGEPIAEGRWSEEKKERIRQSRVHLTTEIAKAIFQCETPPKSFLSGSAVGIYGDRGDELLTDESSLGTDFLADVCIEWERAAKLAANTRVCLLRTGIVLGNDGGAWPSLRKVFRSGFAGPLGDGKQYMPWVHIADVVNILLHVIMDTTIAGPINVVAPTPVTNREFTKLAASSLRRPAFFRAPRFALKTVLGEKATMLLASQRVVPSEQLAKLYQFPTLSQALLELTKN